MAFRINSQVVIDDSRQIGNIGVATVGILSVTSASVIDGAMEFKGGASFSGTSSITLEDGDITLTNGGLTVTNGVLTGDGSGLTNISATGVNLDGTDISPRNLDVTGISTLQGGAEFRGLVTIDPLDQNSETLSGLRFGPSGHTVYEISNQTDLDSAGDTFGNERALPTERAVKGYVDSQVGGSNDLALQAEGGAGGFGNIDLVANEVLNFAGAANGSIVASIESEGAGVGNTVFIGLTDDVTINRNLEVTGFSTFTDAVEFGSSIQFGAAGQTLNEVVISGTPLSASNTDLQIPTAKLVFDELSSLSGTVDGQAVLNISAEDGASVPVDLAGGRLDFAAATANDVVITATPGALATDKDTLTIGLAPEAKIQTSLVVGEGLGAGAGDLITASATATDGTPGVAVAGDLKVSGNVDSASDAKLKENIEVIPAAMEKVAALRGVSYNWISSGKASAGVVAQEVQAVMPELVTEGENHLTVQYNGLVGLLIEAVKEQQAQIEELKAKLG